ncbi:hypothetical protein GA0115235_10242 [Streptomyces sp. DpondAA-F4a]|nr:hypothetical protein GA0115235_10242 [Streptomyces sp. DpondAA-F4a]
MAGVAAVGGTAGGSGVDGSDASGALGDQPGWKPPPAGRPGTANGGPCGGGGGARGDPAPPDESPDAFCVYQAGGV